MRRSILSMFLIGIAGCTSFPALDSIDLSEDTNAPYPNLVPLPSGDQEGDRWAIDPSKRSGLTARIAALKQRAAQLRRTNF